MSTLPTSDTSSKIPLTDKRSLQWLHQWADAVYNGDEHPTLGDYVIPTGVAMQFLLQQFPTRLDDIHQQAGIPNDDVTVPQALLARAYRGILLLDKQQEVPQFNANAIQRTWAYIQKPHLQNWSRYGEKDRPIYWQSDFGKFIDVELTQEDFSELKALFKNTEFDLSWILVYEVAANILANKIKAGDPVTFLDNFTTKDHRELLQNAYNEARTALVGSWNLTHVAPGVFPEDLQLVLDPANAITNIRQERLNDIIPVPSDANQTMLLAITKMAQQKSRELQMQLGESHRTNFQVKVKLQEIAQQYQSLILKLAKPWYWNDLKNDTLEQQAETWAWTTSWANVDKWEPLLNNMSIFPGVEEIGTKGYTGKDELWWTITPFEEKYEEAVKWMGPARETLKEQSEVNYLDDFFQQTGVWM